MIGNIDPAIIDKLARGEPLQEVATEVHKAASPVVRGEDMGEQKTESSPSLKKKTSKVDPETKVLGPIWQKTNDLYLKMMGMTPESPEQAWERVHLACAMAKVPLFQKCANLEPLTAKESKKLDEKSQQLFALEPVATEIWEMVKYNLTESTCASVNWFSLINRGVIKKERSKIIADKIKGIPTERLQKSHFKDLSIDDRALFLNIAKAIVKNKDERTMLSVLIRIDSPNLSQMLSPPSTVRHEASGPFAFQESLDGDNQTPSAALNRPAVRFLSPRLLDEESLKPNTAQHEMSLSYPSPQSLETEEPQLFG